VLETTRLVLRPLSMEDLDEIARFVADPETMRYIGAGGPRTREQAQVSLERMIASFQTRGFGQLGVERKEDGALLGRCGLLVWDPATWTLTDEDRAEVEIEVGYLIGREFWGNGYATEAATAVRDWALAELGLKRLIALIYPENIRSIRVAEKLGMEPEDEIDFFGHRLTRYALAA
jgi:[ribosomal protein S5]-alanine N-acetyltransferase